MFTTIMIMQYYAIYFIIIIIIMIIMIVFIIITNWTICFRLCLVIITNII